MPRKATKEPLGARLLRALSAAFAVLLLLALILVAPRGATAAATVTPATGGTNLTVGTFAPLNGPSVQGGASGDIGLGDIVLQAPAGFEFDPPRSVTARVTAVTGTNRAANRALLVNGAASQTGWPTLNHINITVTRATAPEFPGNRPRPPGAGPSAFLTPLLGLPCGTRSSLGLSEGLPGSAEPPAHRLELGQVADREREDEDHG